MLLGDNNGNAEENSSFETLEQYVYKVVVVIFHTSSSVRRFSGVVVKIPPWIQEVREWF